MEASNQTLTNQEKLKENIAYELTVINYVRSSLFSQSELPEGSMEVTLGDVGPTGKLKRQIGMTARCSISGDSIKKALSRFRPLAFVTTFKIQDMIVEWILEQHQFSGWSFKEKKKEYRRLRNENRLVEPELFRNHPQLGRAFWELYSFFEPFRSTIIHSSGVELHTDGSLQISDPKSGRQICLSESEQGAYLRAVNLIAENLAGLKPFDQFYTALVKADLALLYPYHRVGGFNSVAVAKSFVTVNIQENKIESMNPLTVRIDFSEIGELFDETYGSVGHVFFDARVVVETSSIKRIWEIPMDVIRREVMVLMHGDPQFDCYLIQ